MSFAKIFPFAFLLLTSFITVKAQEAKDPPTTLTKTETSGFSFEKIIDLPSVSKEQAYDRVKQWVLNNLKTTDNNIAFDDKEKGNINTSTAILLGKVEYALVFNAVEFKINFSFKENKMRIMASQFMYHGRDNNENNSVFEFDKMNGPDYSKKVKRIIYEKFDEKFSALIAGAEAAANKKDDKW